MAKVDFSLVGFDGVRAKLAQMKKGSAGAATRKAVHAAALVVKNAAKSPVTSLDDAKTGRRIVDNLRLQYGSRFYKQTGMHMYRLGFATDHKNIKKGNPDTGRFGSTPHWHFQEYGTQKQQERPYMRTALKSNINPAITRFAVVLDRELTKALK